MKELFEVMLEDVKINHDKTILRFIQHASYPNNDIYYRAEGGCCSKSWFEDVINPEVLFHEIIIGIEVLDNGSVVKKEEGYKLLNYGYRLKTLKGYCDIIFRNESNGYYDGWVEFYTEYYGEQYFKDQKFVSLINTEE